MKDRWVLLIGVVAIAAAVTMCLILEQTALFRPREDAP